MRSRTMLLGAGFLVILLVGAYFVWAFGPGWPMRFYIATAEEERALEQAREKLPFVSLTSRMPKGLPIKPGKPLSADAQAQWEEIERAFGDTDRAEKLKALHARTGNVFVGRPGAGKGRMLETTEDVLYDSDFPGGDRSQPGQPANFPLSANDQIDRVAPDKNIRELHQRNVFAFLPPRSLGYVKNRDEVAGFRPHGFRHVSDSVQFRVDHVLLIGILNHQRPVVYLTEKLPSMDQVRSHESRALDPVEEAGLSTLRDGEDLYVVSKDNTLRMIGALRATKTCQKCHDASVGDLLGALSYTLRSREKIEEKRDE
jgi:hypothetical protein